MTKMCTFGVFGLLCETAAAFGAAGGFTRQPEKKTPNVHISLQTPPTFHEKTPRETEEERAGEGKKLEILGPPPFGTHPSGLHFSGIRGPTFFFCCSVLFLKKKAKRLKRQFWPKSAWPKSHQPKFRVLPLSERLVACRNFLERARKRVARAEDLIAKTTEQKSAFVLEVQEAGERVQQLEVGEANTPPSEPTVTELQRRMRGLVRERGALRVNVPMQGLWSGDGHPSIDAIPPMPTSSNLPELQGWLSDQNCELHNALEFGDTTIAKVGQGTVALGCFVASGTLDGPSRSIFLMSAVIGGCEATLFGCRIGSCSQVSPRVSDEAVDNVFSIDHVRVRR